MCSLCLNCSSSAIECPGLNTALRKQFLQCTQCVYDSIYNTFVSSEQFEYVLNMDVDEEEEKKIT